ncbi:hypothetical protein F1880_006684 [Penicillium rolfsii]|nr:hypothetical protein F1880_006684 [Penicillium rolfsii]
MSSKEITRAAALKGVQHVLNGVERVLKWLSESSNLAKDEIDKLEEDLDDLKSKAGNNKAPPIKAISDLSLKEKVMPYNGIDGVLDNSLPELLSVLNKSLQWFELAHQASNQNEALVRVRLNQILGLTLGFAKDHHIVKDQPEEKALS